MKKIEILGNMIIVICISLSTVYSFDWYKTNYINQKENEIIVFSANEIIENKKLNIKKAILNNENVQKAEDDLVQTIKKMDELLLEVSQKLNKPIFKKESVLIGTTKDITPLIKSKLKDKGLL
jgi:hypothetical protein